MQSRTHCLHRRGGNTRAHVRTRRIAGIGRAKPTERVANQSTTTTMIPTTIPLGVVTAQADLLFIIIIIIMPVCGATGRRPTSHVRR